MTDPTSPEAKRPRAGAVVLACMDVRLDPLRILGYSQPDAHILRNAGAVVTDDVIRSLLASQLLLGTRHVDILAHTDCGMSSPAARELGDRLGRDLRAFDDVEAAVRASVARLRNEPELAVEEVRGFVYDVATGAVRQIEP
jgi:carbonic anhydrase